MERGDSLGHPSLNSDMSNAGIRPEGAGAPVKRTSDRQLGHADQWKSERYHVRNQSYGHSADMMAGRVQDDVVVHDTGAGAAVPRTQPSPQSTITAGPKPPVDLDGPIQRLQDENAPLDPFSNFARGYYIFNVRQRCGVSASRLDASFEFSTQRDCRLTQTEIKSIDIIRAESNVPIVADTLIDEGNRKRTTLLGNYVAHPNDPVIRIHWHTRLTQEGTTMEQLEREPERESISIVDHADRVLIPNQDPTSITYQGIVYEIAALPLSQQA